MSTPPQTTDVNQVPLVINREYAQGMNVSVVDFSRSEELKRRFEASEKTSLGLAPGGRLVAIEALDGDAGYSFRLDSNSDGDLSDESSQSIRPGETIRVTVTRGEQTLGYQVTLRPPRDGREGVFTWRPHYRAEGVFEFRDCEALIAVLDVDGDGVFERSEQATNVALDRNRDGEYRGRDEWLKGEQVIGFCGENFTLEIKPDGSSITLHKTAILVPKVGEPAPPFEFTTAEGEKHSSAELKGNNVLLDFWASWCSPCIEKFPALQRMEGGWQRQIRIFAVNVDESEDLVRARKVIEKYGLNWPQVVTGRGVDDPLWKMFGSMEESRLAIPLYVLIDRGGRLVYAGSGGDDMEELSRAAAKLLTP